MENLLSNFNVNTTFIRSSCYRNNFSILYSFIIAKVYLMVHRGYSYSKSYLHTMIMVSVIAP